MQATYEDANLILKLYELRRDETLRKARAWFGQQFKATTAEEMIQKYPMGSQESTNIRMVIGYWDMACSLVTAGVLNQELFFESNGEMLVVWEKLRSLIPGFRQFTGNPKSLSNLEKVGAAFIEHMKSQGPKAYEAFQAMLANMAASSSPQS